MIDLRQSYIGSDGIETQPFYTTNIKLIKSGSLLEIYVFGRDIFLGGRPTGKNKIEEGANDPTKTELKSIDPEASRKASGRRAKKKIKRLIHSNAFHWFKENGKAYKPVTITLTFAENIIDLKSANYELTKFILRLNYEANKIDGRDPKTSQLKYLAVYETQKRGAIHFHIIFFNLPYIENIYNKIRNVWGLGRVDVGGKKKSLIKINDRTKLKKIIDYFIKYIQKSVFDTEFKYAKRYQASKGLIKPVEQYSGEVIHLVTNCLYDNLLDYEYDSTAGENAQPIPYINSLKYSQYDLSKNQKLDKKIDKLLTDYSFDTAGVATIKTNEDFDIEQSKFGDVDDFFNPKTQPSFPGF